MGGMQNRRKRAGTPLLLRGDEREGIAELAPLKRHPGERSERSPGEEKNIAAEGESALQEIFDGEAGGEQNAVGPRKSGQTGEESDEIPLFSARVIERCGGQRHEQGHGIYRRKKERCGKDQD